MVETTEAVRSLNRIKPVTTAVNDTMASAAYWVGSAGREIIINPMGRAGSIGVYRVHRDTSGAKEKLGVKDTLIKAGALKASDQEPLTEESLADYQSKVNQIYDMFLDAVAANRKGKLSRDAARATEGRVYIGEEAVSAGLADRVGILDELIAESPGAARKTFVSAFVPADS
jgi:ClpP class serine protease